MKCPPIIFLGCDKGEFQAANISTQLAPKGAINHSVAVRFVKKRSARIVMNPPIKPVQTSFRLTIKGFLL